MTRIETQKQDVNWDKISQAATLVLDGTMDKAELKLGALLKCTIYKVGGNQVRIDLVAG